MSCALIKRGTYALGRAQEELIDPLKLLERERLHTRLAPGDDPLDRLYDPWVREG